MRRTLNLTESRLMWLRKLDSATEQTGYFVRDGGVTRHGRSGRRMPETVFVWLVEHHLIDVDCGNINLTPRGQAVLKQAIEVKQ